MDLKALLAKLNALGLTGDAATFVASLLQVAEEGGTISDEDLAELSTVLRDEIRTLAGEATDDALALGDALAEARIEVKGHQTQRAEAADARAAKAAELLAATEDDEPAVDEPEVEPVAEDEPAPVEEPTPVAASPAPAKPHTRISGVNARRPAQPKAPEIKAAPLDSLVMTASANLPDRKPGSEIKGAEAIAQAFQEVYDNHVMTASSGAGETKVKVGSLRMQYDEDRQLGMDEYANAPKLARIKNAVRDMDVDALAATGGNCFPLNTDPTIRRYGVTDRPVRDNAMVRMGAPRGGIKTIPPLSISTTAFDTANGVWTTANDVTPSSPTTKPYATLACQDAPRQTDLYALTARLRLGEFNRRFFPELVEAWWDQIAVVQARKAERYMLANALGKTVASSGYAKAVTSGQNFSATRDVLASLDRASMTIRQSRRLGETQVLNFVFPFWLRDVLRIDLSRELPGATDERLAMADAKIDAFFRMRHINPISILEGETAAAEFAIQANAGGLQPIPSTVTTYLYLPGDWLALDGGTLDLGLYRDSTLVGTNDAEMFAETFEAAHFQGLETWRFVLDICPSGITQAAATVSVCTSGS